VDVLSELGGEYLEFGGMEQPRKGKDGSGAIGGEDRTQRTLRTGWGFLEGDMRPEFTGGGRERTTKKKKGEEQKTRGTAFKTQARCAPSKKNALWCGVRGECVRRRKGVKGGHCRGRYRHNMEPLEVKERKRE